MFETVFSSCSHCQAAAEGMVFGAAGKRPLPAPAICPALPQPLGISSSCKAHPGASLHVTDVCCCPQLTPKPGDQRLCGEQRGHPPPCRPGVLSLPDCYYGNFLAITEALTARALLPLSPTQLSAVFLLGSRRGLYTRPGLGLLRYFDDLEQRSFFNS